MHAAASFTSLHQFLSQTAASLTASGTAGYYFARLQLPSSRQGAEMNERTASVPRQRLTRDYLAKQLPIFQERVPKSAQVRIRGVLVASLVWRWKEERLGGGGGGGGGVEMFSVVRDCQNFIYGLLSPLQWSCAYVVCFILWTNHTHQCGQLFLQAVLAYCYAW